MSAQTISSVIPKWVQNTFDQDSLSPLSAEASEKARIERIQEVLNTFNFSQGKEKLCHDISQIKPEALKSLLEDFFNHGMEKGRFKEDGAAIDALAEIIPLEILEKAVETDPEKALQKAKGLFHQAKYYLEQKEFSPSPNFMIKLSHILDALLAFVETILSTFGVADFFESAYTDIQNQIKFSKVMTLISFFNMMTMILVPAIGAEIAGPIIGGILLFIAAASLTYHYFPPAPSHLPHAKNWTKECQNAGEAPLLFSKGRKEILDEMALTLIKGQAGKLKKHPLLIGPSRVGKTQTAKAFAQAIERGDYPELKGKKVFYLNTTKLCKKGDYINSKDPIEQISEAIGSHREDYILVFDEIHVAFQGQKNTQIGQKLKEMLDPNGGFPNVVALTTGQEFKQYLAQDQAFVNRFHTIGIKSTTSEITQEILSHTLITSEEHPFCEKDALKLIYEETKQAKMIQPYASLAVLQDCIFETSCRQISPLKKKIQEVSNEKEYHISQGAISPINFESVVTVSALIEELDGKLKELEADLKKETAAFNRLMDGKKLRTHARMQLFRTIIKIGDLEEASQLTSQDKSQVSSFLLQCCFLAPAIDAFVRTQAKKIGVNAIINEAIVQKSVTKLVKAQSLKKKKLETQSA